MIAYLSGKLAQKDPSKVIIECNGIGYSVKISLNTFSKIGDEEQIKLHTHLMVREDAHTLFGFIDHKEKDLFEQLISISGVGGNTAITILSSITPDELEQAIQGEDIAALKGVKGIGPKTAGRIILELKGKLKLGEDGDVGDPKTSVRREAIIALSNLGFPKSETEKRVDKILKEKGQDVSTEEIIRLALKG